MAVVGERVGYCIMLPPGYDQRENAYQRFPGVQSYPVVYWLHGGRPGSETKNIRVASIIYEKMKAGAVPPMIYVFPNGGRLSHYDHEDSPGEQAFLELVQHVDKTYRTIANRSGRALEGFSQGGRGVGRYMFKHSDLFCSAAPMGGGHQHEKEISENDGSEYGRFTVDPPSNNTWDLARRFASVKHPDLAILIVVGEKDMNFEANNDWHNHLSDLGVKHEYLTVPGVGHSAMQVYEKVGDQIMEFHARNFRHLNGTR